MSTGSVINAQQRLALVERIACHTVGIAANDNTCVGTGTLVPTFVVSRGREKAVFEEASHMTDHMQAADFAAGWAADLLLATNGDYRSLAKRFRWVGVNGVVIPGDHK